MKSMLSDEVGIDSQSKDTTPLPAPTPMPTPRATPSNSSNTSQPTAPAYPTTPRPPTSVPAVTVRCDAERHRSPTWCATTIPIDHDVFSQSIPSIPRLIEVPLVFYRLSSHAVSPAGLDNQIITSLNINASSGLAPSEWASRVGTVIVARKDKKPLLPHHLEAVWAYCDHILDLFGEGEGAPGRLYNREAFETWWNDFRDEQQQFRHGTGGDEDSEDWRTVRSPYVM
ncbi:hypothetical protein F5Y14DRAFT_442979 [Nemania sp. NC0429]|nr:hypothetical protein F5Y14DRAFT_442979 [Nemania sp. NC0429]